jgi:hypothetical protein
VSFPPTRSSSACHVRASSVTFAGGKLSEILIADSDFRELRGVPRRKIEVPHPCKEDVVEERPERTPGRTALMISHDAGRVALLESPELPERTLVAPLPVVREIRAALGTIDVDIRIGSGDAVFISSDLYAAFSEWDEATARADFGLN